MECHHKSLAIVILKKLSECWNTLFKVCGIKIKLNAAYHPKTYGQIERTNKTSRTCFGCMSVRDNNLKKSGYVLVNLCITKQCIAIMDVVHPYYRQNCKTPMTVSTPNSLDLKVLIKWFKKWMKSFNLYNWAWKMLKIEPNIVQIKEEVSENLRWVIRFFGRSHLKDTTWHWGIQRSCLPYFVVHLILLKGLDQLLINWNC